MKKELRLASLISGGGTTMEQIVKACQSGEVPMDVACVISSTPDVGGIKKAKALGVDNIAVVNPADYKGANGKVDQESFGLAIRGELRRYGADVVTQNGWLPLTPELVIDEYKDTIFNQHPGPVPEFGGKGMYGRRVHAARLLFVRKTRRDFWTEVIAQRVAGAYDQGEVLKSQRVEISPDDTVDDLQQRALPAEHRVQIEFLKELARGNVNTVGDRETLVFPHERHILFEVKEIAKLLYPKG